MVRASASALAATATEETSTTLPTPASRVAELGEHIDQSLKIHSPPVESPSAVAAEMLTIPFADPTIKGFVFVREKVVDTAGPFVYESVVFFNGSCVSSVDGCPTRREAITVVEKDLYAKICRTQAFRNEARELNAIIHALDNLSESEHIPAGEPCEWPIVVDEETTADTAPTDESTTAEDVPDAPPPAAPLAGEGEVAVAAAPAPAVEPAPQPNAEEIAAARQRAENAYHAELQAARERHNEAGLYRLGLEDDLKEAKKQEKTALEALRDISQSGPDYRRFAPVAASAPSSTAATSTTAAAASTATLPPPSPEYTPPSPQAGVSEASGRQYRADWKSADISELGLTDYLTGKLRDAGIKTMGDYCKTASEFNGLQDIDGIGQVKSDVIADAFLEWTAKNVDPNPSIAAREAAVADEAVALESAAQSQ